MSIDKQRLKKNKNSLRHAFKRSARVAAVGDLSIPPYSKDRNGLEKVKRSVYF
ncbi:hypothetical protein [Pantoea sp.]|uniref:hypothetical protein n=1 Tax=Pantoea sp. TaxID=69393 RepID=UPI0025DD18B0|nr:hypothetical protein [Pantoea sp.]